MMTPLDQMQVSTVNRETFAGLNFHGIHSTWIFAVILSRYKTREHYVILIEKDL